MDWALEELLQQEHYNDHVQANNNEKEDYIEALHQLLENHVINTTTGDPPLSALPPLLLPPGPRHEEVLEDIPVLLSPPEGYRDPDGDDIGEQIEDERKSSMTAAMPTCPGDKPQQGMSKCTSRVYFGYSFIFAGLLAQFSELRMSYD